MHAQVKQHTQKRTPSLTIKIKIYLLKAPRRKWNPSKHENFERSITLNQPPPQALRFSQGRCERLVMSRKGPWEGYRQQAKPVVSFPPSFVPLFSSTERRLGARQMLSYVTLYVISLKFKPVQRYFSSKRCYII